MLILTKKCGLLCFFFFIVGRLTCTCRCLCQARVSVCTKNIGQEKLGSRRVSEEKGKDFCGFVKGLKEKVKKKKKMKAC